MLVIAIRYCDTFCCFIGIASEPFRYRQMTEITSLKYGVNVSKEHFTKALVEIEPEDVSVRKKKTIKGRAYEANDP